ncbi:MAG: hypothetical protein ACRDPW_09845, partial [Mycobacteriales bacterium]
MSQPQPTPSHNQQQDLQQSSAPCPGCHRMRPRDTPNCPHCGLTLTGELAAALRHIDDELHAIAAAMAYPAASAQAYFGATPAQLTDRYRALLTERGNVLHTLYAGAATPVWIPPATVPTTQGPQQPATDVPPLPPVGYAEPPARPETSPRVVQN